MEGYQNLRSRSGDLFPTHLTKFCILLAPLVVNLHAKFEVFSSNRFPDIEGLLVVNLHVKFEVSSSNCRRDMEGV